MRDADDLDVAYGKLAPMIRPVIPVLLITACGGKAPAPTAGPSVAAGKPATIDRLCKGLETCANMPGLCDRETGLNIWREGSEWVVKVVMGQTGETDKQVRIDLDKGTCDGKPVTIPDVAGGVTVDSLIAGVRTCVAGRPLSFDKAVVARFPTGAGGPPKYSLYLSDGSDKPVAIDIDPATGKCNESSRMGGA